MIHKTFGKGKYVSKPNDKVLTPTNISKMIIDLFEIDGIILDAFMGTGSFYNQYPSHLQKEWCEIEKGKDFFEYDKKVDWIITNPPYSIFDEVLEHSFEIADNIVYLVPLSKVVSSMGRIRKIKKYGGVPFLYILSASKCKFPFGFPACAIYFKRDYIGDTKIVIDNEGVK